MILRRARPEDGSQLLTMIHKHAEFERGTASIQAGGLNDLLQQPDPPIHLFVAEAGTLIGYAALTLDYAVWHGAKTGHLDCLFVAQPHRGNGVGGRLLHHVADAAREKGAIWLEWQTPKWNERATDFYIRQGAHKLNKVRFRMPV